MNLSSRTLWTLIFGLALSALLECSGFCEESPDRHLNLLNNGDFSNGIQGWELHAWSGQGAAAPDPAETRDGKPSIRIDNVAYEDTSLKQKVALKPATRYRLSGWIKTKNVVPQQPKGIK